MRERTLSLIAATFGESVLLMAELGLLNTGVAGTGPDLGLWRAADDGSDAGDLHICFSKFGCVCARLTHLCFCE